MQKIVKKHNIKNFNQAKSDLDYWLNKSSSERLAAVEKIRKKHHGSGKRLQRVARVIKQK